jgi:membrane-associated phospholipid phosphatase
VSVRGGSRQRGLKLVSGMVGTGRRGAAAAAALTRGLVAMWLLVLAIAQAVVLVLVWWIFIRTPHGQVLDAGVLRATDIFRDRTEVLVGSFLNVVSLGSLVVATVVLGFIAIARGRYRLALVATMLIGGANLTSQILKQYVIDRPDLGIPGTDIGAPNSMPSGHMTVAASVAVAAVLVLPARLNGLTAVVGSAYAALTGIAALSAGWHRPSDALASLLIVGIWASGGGYLLVAAQRHERVDEPAAAHHRTVAVLALMGASLLVVAVLAVGLTDQGELTPPVQLSTSQLVGAYVSGAAGVAGATCLVMAVVLSTVHRVVPKLDQPTLIEAIAARTAK